LLRASCPRNRNTARADNQPPDCWYPSVTPISRTDASSGNHHRHRQIVESRHDQRIGNLRPGRRQIIGVDFVAESCAFSGVFDHLHPDQVRAHRLNLRNHESLAGRATVTTSTMEALPMITPMDVQHARTLLARKGVHGHRDCFSYVHLRSEKLRSVFSELLSASWAACNLRSKLQRRLIFVQRPCRILLLSCNGQAVCAVHGRG